MGVVDWDTGPASRDLRRTVRNGRHLDRRPKRRAFPSCRVSTWLILGGATVAAGLRLQPRPYLRPAFCSCGSGAGLRTRSRLAGPGARHHPGGDVCCLRGSRHRDPRCLRPGWRAGCRSRAAPAVPWDLTTSRPERSPRACRLDAERPVAAVRTRPKAAPNPSSGTPPPERHIVQSGASKRTNDGFQAQSGTTHRTRCLAA